MGHSYWVAFLVFCIGIQIVADKVETTDKTSKTNHFLAMHSSRVCSSLKRPFSSHQFLHSQPGSAGLWILQLRGGKLLGSWSAQSIHWKLHSWIPAAQAGASKVGGSSPALSARSSCPPVCGGLHLQAVFPILLSHRPFPDHLFHMTSSCFVGISKTHLTIKWVECPHVAKL